MEKEKKAEKEKGRKKEKEKKESMRHLPEVWQLVRH